MLKLKFDMWKPSKISHRRGGNYAKLTGFEVGLSLWTDGMISSCPEPNRSYTGVGFTSTN